MDKCKTCIRGPSPTVADRLCADCLSGRDHYSHIGEHLDPSDWPAHIRQETADTQQVGGDHYTRLQVQPWAAMEAWMSPEEFQGFLRGNAIKYLARDKGNRLEDWKKARHYLDKLIEVLECPST